MKSKMETNSTTLRNALAVAVKKHVDDNGLSAKQAAEAADVQLSRMYLVLRGDVTKVSSDALVNMLGGFGYRLNVEDGAITLYLGGADKVLPEIGPPAVITNYLNSGAQDFESYITGEDHIAEVIRSHPHLYGELSKDADPDAGRVVSEDE